MASNRAAAGPPAGWSAPRVTPALIVALSILSMGSAFATDIYLPALPDVSTDLAASPALVQASLTVFLVAQAVGNLIIGPMSDRWGRWRPLLASSLLFILASVGAALAPDIWTLLVMRTIQGLGSAAGPVTARAVVADLTHGERAAKLFGILIMLFGLAPIVAPIIGGPLSELGGWRATMWAIVGLAGVIVCVALMVPESLPAEHRRREPISAAIGGFAVLVRNRTFLIGALMAMSAFGIIMSWLAASAFVMQEHYELSPTEYALAFSLNATGFLLAGLLNTALLRRFDSLAVLTGAVAVACAGAFVLLTLSILDALPFWTMLCLVTLTFSAMAPVVSNSTARALAAVRATEVGTASAFLGTIQLIIPAAISPLYGVFGSSPVPMALGFFLYAALLLLLLIGLRRRTAGIASRTDP